MTDDGRLSDGQLGTIWAGLAVLMLVAAFSLGWNLRGPWEHKWVDRWWIARIEHIDSGTEIYPPLDPCTEVCPENHSCSQNWAGKCEAHHPYDPGDKPRGGRNKP